MMLMTPDYSSYSDQELQQVKQAINQDAYPERYQTICAEIAQRQQAVAEAAADTVASTPPPRYLRPIGVGEYVIGGLGFIPFLGLPFSIIALVGGLTTKRKDGKTLALVGGLGIVYLVLLCVMVFIQYHKITDARGPDTQAVQIETDHVEPVHSGDIDDVARLIELYRYRQGQYPESLAQVKAAFPLADVSYLDSSKAKGSANTDFVYQRSEDSYQLLGVGKDGKAHTADDLHPTKAPQQ